MNLKAMPRKHLCMLFAAPLVFVSSIVHAQYFLDDFEDGSISDGTPISWTVPSWVPNGQFRVENGDLVLTPSDVPPSEPGYNQSRTEMDVVAEGLNIRDLSLRTRVRGLSPGNPSAPYYIGVTARDTLTRDNLLGSFISAYIGSDGRVGVGYVRDTTAGAGGGTAFNYPLVTTGLNFVTQDVNLQLDVAGNRATLTAWGESQPKPASPQVNVSLPSFLDPQGTVVLWVFPVAQEWNKPAAFRYVEVAPIPEPSTVFLMLIGLALMGRRRR